MGKVGVRWIQNEQNKTGGNRWRDDHTENKAILGRQILVFPLIYYLHGIFQDPIVCRPEEEAPVIQHEIRRPGWCRGL